MQFATFSGWKKRELYDSFTLLGSDPEEADVEFAFEAKREAVGDPEVEWVPEQ